MFKRGIVGALGIALLGAPAGVAAPVPAAAPVIKVWEKSRAYSSNVIVASNDAGQSVFVFDCKTTKVSVRVYPMCARTRTSDGVLGPVREIADLPYGGMRPVATVDEDGTGSIVWGDIQNHLNRLYGRRITVDGRLSPAVLLSQTDHGYFPYGQMVVAGDTTGTNVVWARRASVLEAIHWSADGTLSTVDAMKKLRPQAVAFAPLPDGRVALVTGSAYVNPGIDLVTLSRDGQLGKSTKIAGRGIMPTAAADDAGNLTIGWFDTAGSVDKGTLYTRDVAVDGTLGDIVRVGSPASTDANHLHLTFAVDGTLYATWVTGVNSDLVLWANRRTNGMWGTAVKIGSVRSESPPLAQPSGGIRMIWLDNAWGISTATWKAAKPSAAAVLDRAPGGFDPYGSSEVDLAFGSGSGTPMAVWAHTNLDKLAAVHGFAVS